MTTSIASQVFTAYQTAARIPVGGKAVLPAADYAGTVTTVSRLNREYWAVTMREARNAFSNPVVGVSATVWVDGVTGEYVVDYWDRAQSIEADRCKGLAAALGVAVFSVGRRGNQAGRW